LRLSAAIVADLRFFSAAKARGGGGEVGGSGRKIKWLEKGVRDKRDASGTHHTTFRSI